MRHDRTIVLVAAMDLNRVIGRDGDMPWHLPADLKHFKQTTWGHPIIMGRRTYQSIGRPLPGRQNIVVSRNPSLDTPGCEVAGSLDEAVALSRGDRVMVIGGGQIYREALPWADELVLTLVLTRVDGGDTSFPDFDSSQWTEQSRETVQAGDGNAYDLEFVHWVRATDSGPGGAMLDSAPGHVPGD